jgi:tetratricopeptide (TPR) repeat protein
VDIHNYPTFLLNMRIFIAKFLTIVCLVLSSCNGRQESILIEAASELAQKGKVSEAIEVYNKIIGINPNSKIAYLNKGILLYETAQYNLAVESLTKAIELDPLEGMAYLIRGKSNLKLQDFISAENDFKSAQVSQNTSYEALRSLGSLNLMKKNFGFALKYFNDCLKISDTSTMVYLSRSSAYYEMGEYENSMADCRRVLFRNSDNWQASVVMAKNLLAVNSMDTAKYYLEKARKIAPEATMLNQVMSEYYLIIGEYPLAVAYAEKGLQSEPNSIPLLLSKARGFDGLNKYNQANEIYLGIEKIADSIPEFHYFLAKNLMALGDSATALIEVTDAIAMRPNYPEAYSLRSVLRVKIGDFKGAIDDKEKARGQNLWKKDNSLNPIAITNSNQQIISVSPTTQNNAPGEAPTAALPKK